MLLDVYIKLTSGRVFHMPVSAYETVRAVCEKVATEEGVSASCLRLKYTGKVLNKDHTMDYLGVRPETILKADIIQTKSLTILIKCPAGETIPLTIQNITTLSEIIARIKDKQDKQGPTDSKIYKMKLKGKFLSGDRTLAEDLGIEDEGVLELVEQAAAATYNEEEVVEEELDQATLDELLANFADGLDKNRKVEVVFSFDTTGSMYGSLSEVRNKLDTTVSRLLRDIPSIRIGIMSHGDYCDQNIYVIRSIDLTSNTDDLLGYINNVPRTGGEGPYACYEWVLHKAQELSWSEDAAKALVIIGDVKPHAVSHTDQRINWHEELDKLCKMDIKIYGVQVTNYGSDKYFYKEMAARSNGAYIKFQHFNYLTDMFLAVCYREAGEEQLQQYAEEVKQEGRMTEELTDMFTQLEENPTKSTTEKSEDDTEENKEDDGPRYVQEPWWDPELDHGQPVYTYSLEEDCWTRFGTSFSTPAVGSSQLNNQTGSRIRRSMRWKGKKGSKRCAIM
ncbi:uncharacterized protein LOC119738315 [Patiria miniata]|uniref:Ubiquitin-like domain-containing protein n=1 Tax=Patiria miniata TaxID=46514 RepID=A0A914AZY4_PATMI|nr:uncharacterized protein LOC119738315 [Patiria miniata]